MIQDGVDVVTSVFGCVRVGDPQYQPRFYLNRGTAYVPRCILRKLIWVAQTTEHKKKTWVDAKRVYKSKTTKRLVLATK